jgi:hypothetical protein
MPQSNQLHRNRPLENVSVAYTPQGFIGDQLSPKVPVEHESDDYYVYSKDTMQLPETIRADGAESNRAQWDVSIGSYRVDVHAIHEDITDRQRRNADKSFRLDVDTTEMLTNIIITRHEVSLQSLFQTASNWANLTSLSASMQFSANTVTSNPILMVDSVSSAILGNCGRRPNTMVMNDLVLNNTKEHISIVDRIKYTSAQSVGPDLLSALFRIPKILIPEATYNNSDLGQTETLTRIWNDNVWIGYQEASPGLKKLSATYTFWQNNTGSPYTVKKWREEKIESDRVEVQAGFSDKAVATDAGYLLVDTVA